MNKAERDNAIEVLRRARLNAQTIKDAKVTALQEERDAIQQTFEDELDAINRAEAYVRGLEDESESEPEHPDIITGGQPGLAQVP